jgi:hypothetical protein
MRFITNIFLSLTLLMYAQAVHAQKGKQKKQNAKPGEWQWLFDGKTFKGWRGVYMTTMPDSGWAIEDGCITKIPSKGAESTAGGDIITEAKFSNFELELEWKISPGGNSGIKYYVNEIQPRPKGSAIGLEYQILDDELHPDAKLGRNGNRKAASLYDLIAAPDNKPLNPPGEWNKARIVSVNNKVEHYLNGMKTVEYVRGSEAFRKLVAESKYKIWDKFGEAPEGHILLQDHGDQVWFRNIRIRTL